MIIIIHIPNKEERIKFAQTVQKILGTSQTYIPGSRKVYKTDIGIKATVDEPTYRKLLALIDRRGYSYNKLKESTI